MNRQTRTIVVVLVALVAASAAAYGVYMMEMGRPVEQVEVATRHAVVAAKGLPLGTMLTKDVVKVVDWPAATPLSGGFDNIEAVVDRGLIAPLVENEPIIETKVAPKEAGAGLPPSIPAGMRAMSVRVNEVIGVAGFVVPGTHVDVMVIIKQKEDSLARVVVSNVQVLTAGTRYDQENAREGKPIPSTVVTLLVSPDDAEKIALAQQDGALMLSLRNPTDTEPTQTNGARMAGLFGPPPSVRAEARQPRRAAVVLPPPPPPPPPVKTYVVETIRAAKRSSEEIAR